MRQGMVGVAACLLALTACSGAEDPTSTTRAAPTTSAPPPTTTTTTSTTIPPTTTTTLPPDPSPFVGWWKATDADGSHLDLRVGRDDTFMYWDSASSVCEANGLGHSPETWAGTVFEELEGTPTMSVVGNKTCFPYGESPVVRGAAEGEFVYDAETDEVEFTADGTRYARTPLPDLPALPNPFVGTWEATDSDGTRVQMTIAPDGAWESMDTRSGGCENMGLTYATWSASGTGSFILEGTPTFDVVTTTLCHPADGGDPVVRSEDVLLSHEYREANDEVALLLFHETIFTRVAP